MSNTHLESERPFHSLTQKEFDELKKSGILWELYPEAREKRKMKSIRKTSVSVSCCLYCPHFFVDGHLFEGNRICTKLQKSIEDTIDLEQEVSEHCPLEEYKDHYEKG